MTRLHNHNSSCNKYKLQQGLAITIKHGPLKTHLICFQYGLFAFHLL